MKREWIFKNRKTLVVIVIEIITVFGKFWEVHENNNRSSKAKIIGS
ncbi:hypothetical protein [Candidatus Uabimicrobium sp. HlEnr_7]